MYFIKANNYSCNSVLKRYIINSVCTIKLHNIQVVITLNIVYVQYQSKSKMSKLLNVKKSSVI